jgi:hypothetical protein
MFQSTPGLNPSACERVNDMQVQVGRVRFQCLALKGEQPNERRLWKIPDCQGNTVFSAEPFYVRWLLVHYLHHADALDYFISAGPISGRNEAAGVVPELQQTADCPAFAAIEGCP